MLFRDAAVGKKMVVNVLGRQVTVRKDAIPCWRVGTKQVVKRACTECGAKTIDKYYNGARLLRTTGDELSEIHVCPTEVVKLI